MTQPLIYLPQPIAPEGVAWLQARDYALQIGGECPANCAAILVRTAPISEAIIAGARGLRVIAKHGVGFDNIAVEAATRRGIWVTNAPASNATSVAEWTIGALVALARGFLPAHRALVAGDWAYRDRVLGRDLSGTTLGIIGLGRIGREVARRAALGLDMKILAFSRHQITPENRATGFEIEMAASRAELLRRADFVSLHLPGGEANRGSIGARELELMRPGSFLINAARGEIVDENALAAALQSGHLAGAALDVFEAEPPARRAPLLQLPNVLATPHNAALTHEATLRMALGAARGVHEVLSGQIPTWPVNAPEEVQRI